MTQPTTEPPVACTLGSAELATRGQRWQILYARAGLRRTVIDAGLRVSFRPEPAVEGELRALVATERECCGWASWTVDATADELVLEISSRGDGISVIQRWLLSGESGTA